MKGRDFTQPGTLRPEKKAGWSRRVMAGLVGVVMLLANGSRLARDSSLWTVAAVVSCTVLALYLWNRKVAGGLGDFESREALSDAVSRSIGARRAHLVWYEYVIARNVVRGTYAGERPGDFKSDVYDASWSMGIATRSSMRQVRWFFAAFAALMLVGVLWFSEGDVEIMLMLLGFSLPMVAATVGLTLFFLWWLGRGPVSALGMRVDDAAALPTAERWETLMQIARDENALQGTCSAGRVNTGGSGLRS